MLQLWQWSLILGAFFTGWGLFVLLAPTVAARALKRFPRDRWSGRVLSVVALAWSGWLIYAMPLEFLVPYRRWVPWVTLMAMPLTWAAMPDLLACRALGGLLCLLPAPVLQVARFHPSPWRLVVVVLMYAAAIKGMVLLMSPHYLRRLIDAGTGRPAWLRVGGAVAAALGGVLLVLGWGVFRPG